jgi:hypothetical protein
MLSIQRHPLRLTLGIDSHLRTTERGSNTEISATNSRYRTCEGVVPLASPRRARYKRRAGCLQPENSGPFVLATAPIFLGPCSPGSSLLCLGNRIPSNQSLTRQSPVSPSAPIRHVLSSTSQRPRRAPKRKMGLEVRDMRRCPLSWHRPTRLPVRLDQLQTLEATLKPTLVLPLQPLIVLPATGVVALCCH